MKLVTERKEEHYYTKGKLQYNQRCNIWKSMTIRHDTSWRQQRQLPPCPPGHCLGTLEMLSPVETLNSLLRCPNNMSEEKMPRCPCPFKFGIDPFHMTSSSEKSWMCHTGGHVYWAFSYITLCRALGSKVCILGDAALIHVNLTAHQHGERGISRRVWRACKGSIQ